MTAMKTEFPFIHSNLFFMKNQSLKSLLFAASLLTLAGCFKDHDITPGIVPVQTRVYYIAAEEGV